VPILPVNLGTLGFIAEVNMNDWLDVFLKWDKGELSISRRCMLEISVERDSEIIMKNICLNDAVISYTEIAKLIKLDVLMESGAGETALGSYRCDGLIVATPTGSTAYSMAAGGPILDPEMEAVILNPVCPFALSNRPLVLTSRQTVAITVASEQRSGVLLTIDGQDTFNLECTDRVIVKQADHPALLLFADKHAYYSALRNKLFWSGDAYA
jgi:NAD+ kinase